MPSVPDYPLPCQHPTMSAGSRSSLLPRLSPQLLMCSRSVSSLRMRRYHCHESVSSPCGRRPVKRFIALNRMLVLFATNRSFSIGLFARNPSAQCGKCSTYLAFGGTLCEYMCVCGSVKRVPGFIRVRRAMRRSRGSATGPRHGYRRAQENFRWNGHTPLLAPIVPRAVKRICQ